MVEFNLLPWRERKQQYEKIMLIKIMTGSVAGVIIAWFIIHLMLTSITQNVQRLVSALDMQLEPYFALDRFQSQQKKTTASVQSVIKQQQMKFDLLKTIINIGEKKRKNICLTEIIMQKNGVQLNGKVLNGADLFAFIKSWSAASTFGEIKIQSLDDAGNNQMNFKMKAEMST